MSPLKNIRTQRGEKLANVAAAVCTNVGNLSRIENLKQTASPALAERLSKYFGGAITELQILYPERFAA